MLIDATDAPIYRHIYGEGYHQYFSDDPIYIVLDENREWYRVRHHSLANGITGLFKKCDVKPYSMNKRNNNVTVNIFVR